MDKQNATAGSALLSGGGTLGAVSAGIGAIGAAGGSSAVAGTLTLAGGLATAGTMAATSSSELTDNGILKTINNVVAGTGIVTGLVANGASSVIGNMNVASTKQSESIVKSSTSQIQKNAEQGKAFEKKEFAKFVDKANSAEEQITIKTKDGTKIRVDAIGIDKDKGTIVIGEYKSSATAPLTKNQKIGFPELKNGGGVVVGKGKGIFIGGYEIPPGTEVKIIRP